ncbi:MAG: ECF-type sigma factor, partial [Acidobacteriota bacterium]
AAETLIPLVYAELRKIASGYLAIERRDHTLQPTALVNEAYLRLIDQRRARWQNRSHFFAIAAQLIRRILVDHARRHRARKRGGDQEKIPLTEIGDLAIERPNELLALDTALDELKTVDPMKAAIVEYRFFGGLTGQETADVIGCSRATVKRKW